MEAIEMRIGNHIKTNGVVCTIDALLRNGNVSTDKGDGCLGEFKPIPLTEEWLIKFGFIDRYGSYRVFELYKIYATFYNNNNPVVSIDYGHHSEGSEDLDHIKYVHQLQNLHFALTGKELEAK